MTTNRTSANNAVAMKFRALVFALIATPVTLVAQELHGTVLQADGTTPAAGVVLVMLHATRDDSIVARTVSNGRGSYALKAPTAMTVRLRALRIGYEPMNIGAYELAENASRDVAITLSETRVTIAAFDVRAKNRCETKPTGALLVAQLFNEARTALLASASLVNGISTDLLVTNFERNEDRNGRLIGDVVRTKVSGNSSRAFGSISATALANDGYIVEQADGTTMYAPDADVLTSPTFIEQHCFFLVNGTDANASMIGIGFRPVSAKRNFVDIRGTLWLDRNSAALQYIEYAYEGLPVEISRLKLGGRVNFAMTAAGYWFVSGWQMRKPRMTGTGSASLDRARVANAGRPTVAGVQAIGGEVQTLQLADQLLYSNSRASSAGARNEDAVGTRITAMTDAPRETTPKEVLVTVASAAQVATPEFKTETVPLLNIPANKSLLLVSNALGQPIPYATVNVEGGTAYATDAYGRLIMNLASDSTQLVVRRLGHEAFFGKVGRASKSEPFKVMLQSSALQLKAFDVKAVAEKSPLARTGFYQRMEDVRRGAIVGEFMTPEMLDARPGNKLSDMLRSTRYLNFATVNGNVVLLGVAPGEFGSLGCKMNILLDGMRVSGDDKIVDGTVFIDRLVGANEVMAVEIYRSTANAPAALQPLTGGGSCGIVAIWTGGRR
ncbi:MAG: hypothetical protein ABI852_04655 [Gemmatimonadaceae bacterium]